MLICINCGRRHYVSIPDEVVQQQISDNLEKLIKKYGSVCFWGINSTFYEFSKKLKIDKTNLYCVDTSEMRHGMNASGIIVRPTNIIKEKSIKCIVVAVPQYYTYISPVINTMYPDVEQLINIVNLI